MKQRRLFYLLLLPLLLGCLLISPTWLHSAQVGLTWDPNSETDLAGYKIYWGLSSGNYSQNVDVGNVTIYTIPNLSDGQTYYFAATAYSTAGRESGFSNEVVYSVPDSQPDLPAPATSLRVQWSEVKMSLPATDNFNRADGALGSNWSTITGLNALIISNNAVVVETFESWSGAYWNADSFNNDQYSQAKVSGSAYHQSIICRVNPSSADFYGLDPYNTDYLVLRRWDNGTPTDLFWHEIDCSDKTIRLECTTSGNTVVLNTFLDGTPVETYVDSDANRKLSGSPGIMNFAWASLDDWEGGNVSSGGTPINISVSDSLAFAESLD
jgi:hypothetical protein